MTTTPDTPDTYVLPLPYTSPPLHANQRWRHWAQEAAVKRSVRRDAHLLARSGKLPRGCQFATITLHWAPTLRRERDAHNLYPLVKALIDGLTRGTKKSPGYGLTPDDSTRYVSAPEPVIHEPGTAPRQHTLWLEITVEGAPQ